MASPKIHDLIDKNSTLFIIYSNKYKECKTICLTVSLSILTRVSRCASVVDCRWLCVGRHLSCIGYRLSCVGVVRWCHVFHRLSLIVGCWPSAVAGRHRVIPYCRRSSLVGRRPSLLSAVVGARPGPILAGCSRSYSKRRATWKEKKSRSEMLTVLKARSTPIATLCVVRCHINSWLCSSRQHAQYLR